MASKHVSVEDDELFTWLVALANSDSEGSVEVSLSRAKAVYKRIAERESQAELRGKQTAIDIVRDNFDEDDRFLSAVFEEYAAEVAKQVAELTAPTSDDNATDGGK